MNPSVAYIRSSDGSGDASLMTITQVRTAPATTITVNTVAGVPTNFFATMGTPHTFTDPVTGETITIISEVTAVNFAGRIDSGKVEIVDIAPGKTDLGSKVGDIIIIRPTTQWADNIHDVLSKSLNDDGTLKNKSVTLASMNGGTTAGVLSTDASGNVGVLPSVRFSYTATDSALSTSASIIKFKTALFDVGSSYSTSTGLFSAPTAGFYKFDATVIVGTSNGGNNLGSAYFYKNGTNIHVLAAWAVGALSHQVGGSGHLSIQLSAGDTIGVYANNSIATNFPSVAFSGELVSAP